MCFCVCVYTYHIFFIHSPVNGHVGCFLEKAVATHSSTLAWKLPLMEEPGRLQSMGSHRVGHDWNDLAAAAYVQSFPDSSIGKESACSAGDSDLISGSGRSAGEGIGYPLQYSWASLVAKLVKNPPVIQQTCVQSLGLQDPLQKGMATHSSILAWRIPWAV